MAQRIILGCSCLIIALIALFPPTRYPDREDAFGNPQPARGSLLAANFYKRERIEHRWESGKNISDKVITYHTLDTRRLSLELLLTAALTGGAIAVASAIRVGRSATNKDAPVVRSTRAAA
jgi:hypothetical protein